MSKEAKSPTIFYGWFVVAACFIATFTLGEAQCSFGLFFKPLEDEFGWSRALVSSGYTAFMTGYAISVISAGRLVDRYSPRPILIASAVITGLGISLCSQIQSITQLCFLLLLAGVGTGANFPVPTSTVQRWFHQRQGAGLALGIVIAGVGAGALVLTPLVNYLILSYGWRNAYLILGILFFLLIAIASLMIRPSPVESRTVPQREGRTPNPNSGWGWTTRKALATSSFAGITFIMCIALIAFQTMTVHLVPHAMDVGISATVSAAALGLLGGASIPGRVMSGALSEKMSWKRILALSCFGMMLSLLWLLFLGETWMLYCFVFLFGICHGSRVSASIGAIGEFFGMRSLGALIGISGAVSVLAGAFAPYAAGFIFDTTGSYSIAFVIMMILLLISGITAIVIKKPSLPEVETDSKQAVIDDGIL